MDRGHPRSFPPSPQVVPPGVRETSPAQSSAQHRVKRLVQVHGVPGSAGEAVRRGVSRGRVLSSQRPPVGWAKQPLQGSLHQVGNKGAKGKGQRIRHCPKNSRQNKMAGGESRSPGTASGESWRPHAHPQRVLRGMCALAWVFRIKKARILKICWLERGQTEGTLMYKWRGHPHGQLKQCR